MYKKIRMGHFKNTVLLSLAFVLFFSPAVFSAETRGRLELIKVSPRMAISSEYSDNIYLNSGASADEPKNADIIHNVKPSLMVTYPLPGKRGRISCGYNGNFAFYTDDSENDWQGHTGLFNVDYKAPGGLSLSIKESYKSTEDPYSTSSDYSKAYKEGYPLTQRWVNDFDTKIGYERKNLGAELYFRHYGQRYKLQTDFASSYLIREGGAGAKMKIASKTWAFIRYHYGVQDYTDPTDESSDSDSTWSRVNAGASWDSKSKINGEFNLGYQWREYDAQGYADAETWIASTDINYKLSDMYKFTLNLARIIDTTDADTQEYSVNTTTTLKFRHLFHRKANYSLEGSYEWDEYNHSANKPDDNIYKFVTSLNYTASKYLTLTLNYNYKKKDAYTRSSDYENNRFTLGVNLKKETM